VLHTGGNDFIGKIVQVMSGASPGDLEILKPNPGAEEASRITKFYAYRSGGRSIGGRSFRRVVDRGGWSIGGLVDR